MMDMSFFLDTIFIVMLVYIYFFGTLCRAFIVFFFWVALPHPHFFFFFMGHILKIMGWVWDLPCSD